MDLDRAKTIIAALLSEEGRTPEEMESARKQAAKLLVKFGLTEEEVTRADRDMTKASLELTRYGWVMGKWFAKSVAELTGTRSWMTIKPTANGKRSDRKDYTFAGYRPDVEQAEWMLAMLLEAGMRGCKSLKTDRSRSDFLTAFAQVVHVRLKALIAETQAARAEVSGATDLVVVKEANVADFVSTLGLKLAPSKASHGGIKDGYAAQTGVKAGKAVSFSKPVSGKGPLALN